MDNESPINYKDLGDHRKSKVLISLIFSLLGFVLNMLAIKIYNHQGINITIMLGQLFPLFIAIVWGWKYGLITALLSMVPSMSFIWYADGYGLLYLIPINILWVVWHGIMANYRKKTENLKWYHSIYIAELAFRVFSELGIILIYSWLISNNPPVWDTSLVVNSVSSRWYTIAFLNHIVVGLILTLAVQGITRIKRVKQVFKIRNPHVVGQSIIVFSLLLAFLLNLLEALACTIFSVNNSMSLMDNFFKTSPKQIFTRTIIFVICLASGIITFIFYQRLGRKNLKLNEQKNKTKSILSLTERINLKTDIDDFLLDLLNTSLEIIDEADFGIVIKYQEDKATVVSVSGHDKKLINFTVESMLKTKDIPDILRIKNGKEYFLNKVKEEEKEIINKYVTPSSESIYMIFSFNGEKTACIIFDKAKGEFSEESIKLAKTIRNIPLAYFATLYSYQEKQTIFNSIIFSIVKILSLHNEYTKEHSLNVAYISRAIARKMDLSENEVELYYWTGLVHDIGKILIPDEILDKKGKLSEQEWKTIQMHPVYGYETLNDNKNLKEIAEHVLFHHERWDGKGYPKGISGEDIPLASRIIAVADTFDAMTNDRPYRKALDKHTAVEEIRNNMATQFDPNIAKIFIDNVDEILDEVSNYSSDNI